MWRVFPVRLRLGANGTATRPGLTMDRAYRDCKQAWVERRRMDSAPWLFQTKESKAEPKE